MTVKEIKIKDRSVWLAIDQLRMYSQDLNCIEDRPEYMCYFKLTEPTPIIYGELLRDQEAKPILFTTIDDAIREAKELLNKRL